MRRTLTPVLLLLLLLAGCRPKQEMPKTTAAAWEVYQHYADREDITVAFIGDYAADSCTFDLVMFQVPDSATFVQLKEEFGLLSVDKLGHWRGSRMSIADTIIEKSSHAFNSTEEARDLGAKRTSNQNGKTDEEDTVDFIIGKVIREDSVVRPGVALLRHLCSKYSPLYHTAVHDDEKQLLYLFFCDSQEQFNRQIRIMLGHKEIISSDTNP